MIINNPEDVCQIVRTIRTSIKMSQEDLSINSGVSKATIISIETGRRIPSIATLMAIIESFGYTIDLDIKPKC